MFILLLGLSLVGRINAQTSGPKVQHVCIQDAMPKEYVVDSSENGGLGTNGSLYTWVVLDSNSKKVALDPAPVLLNPSQNVIQIDWSNVVVGTYSLVVTETDVETGCSNDQALIIIIEDCACTTPAKVEIANVDNICSGQEIILDATLTNASSVTWTTNGTGTFDDTTSLTPTYIPSEDDITNGKVTITATTEDPDGICEAGSDSVEILIEQIEEVTFDDLPTAEVCSEELLPEISDLPTTSIEDVKGTWTVSNKDNIYTYTFTLDADQDKCYKGTEFTVTITESVATEFDYEDDEVCDVLEVPALESLDTKDKNGVEGIWKVEVEDQVHTFTFTPDDTCYTEFSFTVTIIESVATEFDYEDDEVCDASEVPAVESLDTKDKNGVEGIWTLSNV
ncbi:MAG: hypothetical protein ACR2MS_07135, partial [Weeksellaceae bacterium]